MHLGLDFNEQALVIFICIYLNKPWVIAFSFSFSLLFKVSFRNVRSMSRFFTIFHLNAGELFGVGRREKKNPAISGTIWQKNREHFEDLPGLNLDPYVEEFCHLSPLVISGAEHIVLPDFP